MDGFVENYTKKGDLKKNEGYIYIVKIDNIIKIGSSKRPRGRFAEYRCLAKESFDILLCIMCNHYQVKERGIRYAYKRYVQKGREWLKIPEKDVALLKVLIKHYVLGNIETCVG